MAYEIIITDRADAEFDQIIGYVLRKLENAQAARSIIEDYEKTKQRLSLVADGLRVRTDLAPHLKEVRTIKFRRHKYIIAYTIKLNEVIVLGIYHSSQDLKSKLTRFNSII